MEIRSLSTMPVVHLTNKQVASPTKEQGEIAKAVVNNKISAAYIGDKKDKKEIEDVEIANYEASGAEIRDVLEATELAKEVAINLKELPEKAIDAQANQTQEKVWSLLE